MIDGNVNEFVDNLYYGSEMYFIFRGKKYFIQGNMSHGKKNLKKLKAKKRRVMNGFNTGTRDMKLKTAYQRRTKWSAEDADNFICNVLSTDVFHLMNSSLIWYKLNTT